MIGESDGPGWMRRGATILVQRHLPSFPRGLEPLEWHWHASPDVAVQLHSLHFPEGTDPGLAEELFGYRVDVDETYAPGTLEIVQDHVAVFDTSPVLIRDNHAVVVSDADDPPRRA